MVCSNGNGNGPERCCAVSASRFLTKPKPRWGGEAKVIQHGGIICAASTPSQKRATNQALGVLVFYTFLLPFPRFGSFRPAAATAPIAVVK